MIRRTYRESMLDVLMIFNKQCRAAVAMARDRALCRGCSCAKGKRGCTDCYPGRKGKFVNASIAAPQTSSQLLPRVLSPSRSSAEHASQPSLPTPAQPLEHGSYALPPCVKANRPCTQLPPTPSPLSSSVQPQSTGK